METNDNWTLRSNHELVMVVEPDLTFDLSKKDEVEQLISLHQAKIRALIAERDLAITQVEGLTHAIQANQSNAANEPFEDDESTFSWLGFGKHFLSYVAAILLAAVILFAFDWKNFVQDFHVKPTSIACERSK